MNNIPRLSSEKPLFIRLTDNSSKGNTAKAETEVSGTRFGRFSNFCNTRELGLDTCAGTSATTKI